MQRHYPEGSPYRNTFSAFAAVWREGAYQSPALSTPATSSYTQYPALARTVHTASTHSTTLEVNVRGGIESLYRGIGATTIRGIILSTSQICAYDQVKQTLKRRGVFAEGIGLHLTSSLFAGLFCSITSNPVGQCFIPGSLKMLMNDVDVIKVRVHSDKERRYKGVFDCVRIMLKNEGPLAFYKGFGMCWARVSLSQCYLEFPTLMLDALSA